MSSQLLNFPNILIDGVVGIVGRRQESSERLGGSTPLPLGLGVLAIVRTVRHAMIWGESTVCMESTSHARRCCGGAAPSRDFRLPERIKTTRAFAPCNENHESSLGLDDAPLILTRFNTWTTDEPGLLRIRISSSCCLRHVVASQEKKPSR
jgi:hypothetical protein